MLFAVVFTAVRDALAFGKFSRAWYTFDSTSWDSTINSLSSFFLSSCNSFPRSWSDSLYLYYLKSNSASLFSIFILKNERDSLLHHSITWLDRSIKGAFLPLPGNLTAISNSVLIILATLLFGKSLYRGKICLVKSTSSSNKLNCTKMAANL